MKNKKNIENPGNIQKKRESGSEIKKRDFPGQKWGYGRPSIRQHLIEILVSYCSYYLYVFN